MNEIDTSLWHPGFRINRALRVMLHMRWSAASWSQVKTGLTKVLALTIKRVHRVP